MKRASLAAAFAASLLLGSVSAAIAADEARLAEERLLGSADEASDSRPTSPSRARSPRPASSPDRSTPRSREAGRAGGRDARGAAGLRRPDRPRPRGAAGDRFYVRYEQTFTAEGAPIGIGRVLWAELRTRAKGTVAIHRFRTPRQEPSASGWRTARRRRRPRCACRSRPSRSRRASACAPIRSTSRRPFAASGKPAPMGGPKRSAALPPGLPTGGVSGKGSAHGQHGDAARRVARARALWQLAGRAARRGGARCSCTRASISWRRPARRSMPRPTGSVVGAAPNGGYGNWIRIEHGGSSPRSTAISRPSPRASSRASRWCRAS